MLVAAAPLGCGSVGGDHPLSGAGGSAAGTGGSAGGKGGSGGGAGGATDAGAPPLAISVDFVGGSPTVMAPTELAGVVRVPQWNPAAGATGSILTLATSTGAATTAAVSWAGENVFQLGIADTAGDNRMMNGYLDPFGMATVSISALPSTFTARGYDVYVYANGAVGAGDTRTGTYSVAGMNMTVTQGAGTPFAGTFTQAIGGGTGNYVVFRGLTAASFSLNATPATGQTKRAPVNGMQIVAR